MLFVHFNFWQENVCQVSSAILQNILHQIWSYLKTLKYIWKLLVAHWAQLQVDIITYIRIYIQLIASQKYHWISQTAHGRATLTWIYGRSSGLHTWTGALYVLDPGAVCRRVYSSESWYLDLGFQLPGYTLNVGTWELEPGHVVTL